MNLLRIALALSFVAACGGGNKTTAKSPESPKPDPIPVSAGPDCKAVADHLVTVVLADKPDIHAKAIPVLRAHCTDDKWSDEVRSCMATASNDDESDACAKKLTVEQRDRLEDDAKKVMSEDGKPAMAGGGASSSSVDKPADAPKPKTRGTTRGATKKPAKGTAKPDPCQGGQADPCQGGQ